jgi:hypothetical protein
MRETSNGFPWQRLLKPFIALVLGTLPFWIFYGIHRHFEFDGRTVRSDDLNVFGLVLSIIGLMIAVQVLRGDDPPRPRWWPRTALAALALMVCVFQVGLSGDAYRIKDVAALFTTPPMPPPPDPLPLRPESVLALREAAQTTDRERLLDGIVDNATWIRRMSETQAEYAAACHGGQGRLDIQPMPGFLTEADRAAVAAPPRERRLTLRDPCSAEDTLRVMGRVTGAVLRERERLAILVAGYAERFGDAPWSAPAPASTAALERLEDAPITPGASVTEVQRAFRTDATPRPQRSGGNGDGTELSAPRRGMTAYFDASGHAISITFSEEFEGEIGGIRIGDTERLVRRRFGEPAGPAQGGRPGTATLVYGRPGGGSIRFDIEEGRGVERIALLR